MSGAGRKSRGDGGFTLTELLVVLAVAGLLFTALPIAYSKLVPGAEFQASVKRALSDMREARVEATTTGRDIVFEAPQDLDMTFKPTIESDFPLTFLGQGGAIGGEVTLSQGQRARTIRVDWLTGRAELLERGP